MRFKLKRALMILVIICIIPFIMHIMEVLRFKSGKMTRKRIGLKLPPLPQSGTCDVGKCNPTKEGMLNVHIVAHSHDDVGWKKTMDQYYSGNGGGNAQSFYQGGECTRCILDNAIRELLVNPNRRFIFVEMAFFSLWFAEQTLDMKQQVRELIDGRRLELVIGGWCMSDSATTYYDDIIDQHTLGFQWIQKEFGQCAMPKSAWHVDQFGHSREHSSLFAQMGFDGIFLGRIDFQDQERRTRTGNMETIWRTSPDNLGDKASLFTSVLFDGYFSPERFRWEGWGPGMLSEKNKDHYVKAFLEIAHERAKAYHTNHVLIPFGGDFAFNTAAGWFDGIDNLIKYVNAKTEVKVNVLYSTPSCYINAVNNNGSTLETMESDFFPYSTIPNTFWTGFFTSRPGLKRHIKDASSVLQTCKAMAALTRLKNVQSSINTLKEAVAVLQHHDAITGTEKQHVTDDYNRMLSEGEVACQTVIDSAYRRLLTSQHAILKQEFCHQLNISVCSVTENANSFILSIFNPLGNPVSHFVRLPIPGGDYTVWGEGKNIDAETVPLPESTKHIPERGNSIAKAELVFLTELPPLGYSTYKIKKEDSDNTVTPLKENTSRDIVIENEYLSLVFDGDTGLTKTLTNVETNEKIEFEQSFLYYKSSPGEKRNPNDRTGGFLGSHKRSSGAYAFVPKEGVDAVRLRGSNGEGVKVKTFKGINALEVHQDFGNWVSQVTRLYDGARYLEMEWTVGPIPERESKDVVSSFQTSMSTHGLVYTDSNGREMVQRKLNSRETWNLTMTSPISSNYYPVTGRIQLKDVTRQLQLTVVTDRCQGGASLTNGHIELMVHRRTFFDDDLGVEEPLNEKGINGKGLIVRGKHYVFLDAIKKASRVYRPIGLQMHHQPVLTFMRPAHGTSEFLVKMWSGLSESLPYNVHLLTLDQIPGKTDEFLVRLENYFEKSELIEEDQSVELQLQDMFTDFLVITVQELSLGGNHDVISVKRLRWKTKDGTLTPAEIGSIEAKGTHEPPFPITLNPMEIRTFHMKVVRKEYVSES